LTKFTGDFICLPKISKPKCRDFFVTDYLYKQQNTLEKYQTGKKTPKKKEETNKEESSKLPSNQIFENVRQEDKPKKCKNC